MSASTLSGGFAEPVLDAQRAFRAVMQAMARPGTVQPLGVLPRPPAPLTPELAAVALTLIDHETPVWLGSPLRDLDEVRRWLAFHTGAPVVDAPEEADFAFAASPQGLPALSAFRQGTAEYPDLGATVVLGLPSLAGGVPVRLAGPGIAREAAFAPEGLAPGWWRERIAMRDAFPLGVDLVFCARGHVAGLPRSTRIETMEAA